MSTRDSNVYELYKIVLYILYVLGFMNARFIYGLIFSKYSNYCSNSVINKPIFSFHKTVIHKNVLS